MSLETPSARVTEAFSVRTPPRPLSGGQGGAYVAGDVVLKRASNEAEAVWGAEVMSEVIEDGFQVARPLRSRGGSWIEDGWTAWRRVPGVHDFRGGRCAEIVDTCRRFHAALSDVSKPEFLDGRDTAYDRASRAAFGEISPLAMPPMIARVTEQLRTMVKPLRSPPQVIHGDLSGNVLFNPGVPPTVIDFTPYWRPASYAEAQVIVDSVLWYGGDMKLADALQAPESEQVIVRATLFRLYVSGQLNAGDPDRMQSDADNTRAIVAWLDGKGPSP